MRAIFVLFAVACAATAIWHGLMAAQLLPSNGSSPARHAVFVVVNVVCCAGFVWRPRAFRVLFGALALQQVASHGGDVLNAATGAVAASDIVVALAMPAMWALLLLEWWWTARTTRA